VCASQTQPVPRQNGQSGSGALGILAPKRGLTERDRDRVAGDGHGDLAETRVFLVINAPDRGGETDGVALAADFEEVFWGMVRETLPCPEYKAPGREC
jgi:hypothetical protein